MTLPAIKDPFAAMDERLGYCVEAPIPEEIKQCELLGESQVIGGSNGTWWRHDGQGNWSVDHGTTIRYEAILAEVVRREPRTLIFMEPAEDVRMFIFGDPVVGSFCLTFPWWTSDHVKGVATFVFEQGECPYSEFWDRRAA